MVNLNTTLRIGFMPVLPYVQQGSDGTVWGDTASKLGNISERLGIKLKWIMPDDRRWGARYPNGTWDGMFGMGMNGITDIVFGPTPRAVFLQEAYTASAILGYEDMQVMGAIPSEYLPQSVTFNIFDLETGLALLGSLLISTLLGMIAKKLSAHYEGKNVPFWSSDILMGYGKTITQEGTLVDGGGGPNRFVFGAWMIGSFFFMNMVTGFLKTGLLIQRPYPRLTSMADLAARPEMKPLMPRICEAIFDATPIEAFRKVAEQARRHQSWVSPVDIFKPEIWQIIARREGVVFCTQKMALSSLPALCPTLGAYAYEISEHLYQMQLVWYYNRTTPKIVQDALNKRIDWLNESPTRWFEDYQKIAQNQYFCFLRGESRAQVSEYEPLGINQFRPFSLLFVICCGLSILALIGERITYRIQPYTKRLAQKQTLLK